MDEDTRIRMHEAEARRLRARFVEDWLVHAVVALDLAVRRAAHAFITGGAGRRRAACSRGTSCRS